MYANYNRLALAILIAAVEDYKFLKELGEETYYLDDDVRIGKKEIRKFFLSNWCDDLLQNMSLTGRDILTYLESE